MISGHSAWTRLQFIDCLVFQASDVRLPGRAYATPAIDAAEQIVGRMLATGPKHFRELLSVVNAAGLSRTSLMRAGGRMGVVKRRGVWLFLQQ